MGDDALLNAPLQDGARRPLEPRPFFLLLSWLSPAFPVGSFSYSHGLEQAVADGALETGEAVLAWVATLMEHGGGWTDAVLLKEAFQAASDQDPRRLQDAADLAQALCPSSERLRETRDQGQAFLAAAATWSQAAGSPRPSLSAAPYPLAVGLCAAEAGVPLGEALLAYLHAFASNLVTIAVRVVPLGQTAGVAVLAGLEETVLSTAARASASSLDDLGGCAFASDIASMRHEALETRVFIS